MSGPRSLREWLDYIERRHPAEIAMGLDRVRAVASRMGLTRPAPHVVSVAGTNGKGSTVAFIEAIARAAGLRVAAYTSPHLLAFNERLRIDGNDATDAEFVVALEAVESARGDIALTYFEFATLAALWAIERSGVDLAVLEVGLGGRLDAVNLVDADVAVITTVDLDHQEWLGGDRERIGHEKVGIARGGRPLVLGEDDPPASVLRHAYRIGASAIRAGCDFLFAADGAGQWRWHEPGFDLRLPMPRLRAPSQVRNAATAIAALRALDVVVPVHAWAEGVASAELAGRLQPWDHGGVEVVVDVGHNPQAARELASWLQATPVTGVTRAVYAALGDKDVAGVATALDGLVAEWHLAGLADAGSRATTVEAHAERLAGTQAAAGHRHAGVTDALQAALAAASPGDRVLVFGSFHTVAAALRWLQAGAS